MTSGVGGSAGVCGKSVFQCFVERGVRWIKAPILFYSIPFYSSLWLNGFEVFYYHFSDILRRFVPWKCSDWSDKWDFNSVFKHLRTE